MGILTKILQEEHLKADSDKIQKVIKSKIDDIRIKLDDVDEKLNVLNEERKSISLKMTTVAKEIDKLVRDAEELVRIKDEEKARSILREAAEKKIDMLKINKEYLQKDCDMESMKLSKHKLNEDMNELISTQKILSYQQKVAEMKKKIDAHGRTDNDIISKIKNRKEQNKDVNNFDISDPDEYADKKLDQIRKKLG